jgi:hypothetical protein
MGWAASWLIPRDSDAWDLAMLRLMKSGNWTAEIPGNEVTPQVAERIQRIAGMAPGDTLGSVECNINARPVVVEVRLGDPSAGGGYALTVRNPPSF